MRVMLCYAAARQVQGKQGLFRALESLLG